MIVGARLGGLSISETAEILLAEIFTLYSLKYLQRIVWKTENSH